MAYDQYNDTNKSIGNLLMVFLKILINFLMHEPLKLLKLNRVALLITARNQPASSLCKKQKCNMWHVARDMWHVERDKWHMTSKMWQMTHDKWDEVNLV